MVILRPLLAGANTTIGGLVSAQDSISFVTRSSISNITYPGGYGGVFGTWSSVSCSSILCDSLLSHITLADSHFSGCSVYSDNIASANAGDTKGGNGGVLYQRDSESKIERCTLSGNTAALSGGVLAADGFSRIELYDVVMVGNSAGQGGSVAAATSVTVTVANTSFTGDYATGQGGSMYLNTVGAVRSCFACVCSRVM